MATETDNFCVCTLDILFATGVTGEYIFTLNISMLSKGKMKVVIPKANCILKINSAYYLKSHILILRWLLYLFNEKGTVNMAHM